MVKFPRAIKTWGEQDAYTTWRKLYCYTQRAGVVKSIKKETHRRERREGKKYVQEQVDE